MKTIIIVGLGNPSPKYAKARHNTGFMFADFFREKFRDDFGFSEWKENKKLQSEISSGRLKEKKIIILKPRTFMNLSGEAVQAAKKYFKVRLEDIIVVQDEVDLPLGSWKFSANRSSAGHNGVQNIIDRLGSKNFTRLRIGIDSQGNKNIPTEKYVLEKFNSAEIKTVKKAFEESATALLLLLQ